MSGDLVVFMKKLLFFIFRESYAHGTVKKILTSTAESVSKPKGLLGYC